MFRVQLVLKNHIRNWTLLNQLISTPIMN